MSAHEKFNFKSKDDIIKKAAELNIDLPLDSDTSVLNEPAKVGTKWAPNRIAVLPMEGCDSNLDGSPSELVERRYIRFASGGSGLLWWEACAIVPEGRANENQMMLTNDNIGQFKTLINTVRQTAADTNGSDRIPLNILQMTHSGRYSRPVGHAAAPIVPQRDAILDGRSGVVSDKQVCSDEYLDSLVERYINTARLAQEAGFDGVDVKACHRYLMNELLASHTREGKYGGSFENRSRLILDVIRELRKAVGDDFIIGCRFNVFDAHPYPYGFGVDRDDFWKFDPTEPMMLVREMCAAGVDLLSNSAGNPYYIYPQVTRPFDLSSMGIPIPDEHPLESVVRLFSFTADIQKAAGSVPVVGNGYTWLRQFAPLAGAANIKRGASSFMGLGRQSIAYPDAARDILLGGGMKSEKCCITCSKCTQIMRDHGMTGCVIRDSEIYSPKYKEYREQADKRENNK